jgi:hypothetical protein
MHLLTYHPSRATGSFCERRQYGYKAVVYHFNNFHYFLQTERPSLLLCYFILLSMYVVLFLRNMEFCLLNCHVKHCKKLRSDTVEFEEFLFKNCQIILSCMTTANPNYRNRHTDLYEQTLRMRSLGVLVVRKGGSFTISIFRSHKTFIYSFKKRFILKLFLTIE